MNILYAIYMASIPSSLITNIYLTKKSFNKANKEGKRKLKYKKGLNYRTKDKLSQIKKEEFKELRSLIVRSLIPIYNIYYTISSIEHDEELSLIDTEFVNEIYDEANEQEDLVRKMNLDFLRSIKDKLITVPEDIQFDDEYYRPSDNEVKKVLKSNKLNYDVEMLKYEKENNIKY